MNVRGVTSLQLYVVTYLLASSVATADDDDDNSNNGPSNQQTAEQTVFRMDDGDEFNNPNGCSSTCPTGSSAVSGDTCLCKCVLLWTWRQDLGKCQLEFGCAFSVSSGSHVPTMTFEEERDRLLKPDHVVQRSGKSVMASDNYYIKGFHLLRYDGTTWTMPKLSLWFDFIFSTKNVEYQAIMSRSRSQDLEEYYGSLVNFTIGQSFKDQGCLMVKFSSNITAKSGQTGPLPSPYTSLVKSLFESNGPTVHHPNTPANVGQPGLSTYTMSIMGLTSQHSEHSRMILHQRFHETQTALLSSITRLVMSSSFVDGLGSDGLPRLGDPLLDRLVTTTAVRDNHVTSAPIPPSSSILDDDINKSDEGLESTTLIVAVLAGGVAAIFLGVLMVAVAVRRVMITKKKGQNRDDRGGHVSTNSIQCVAFPQSSPPGGQNISAPWYSTLTAINRQSTAATTTPVLDAQIVTNVTTDSTVRRGEEQYEQYLQLHPYERPGVPVRFSEEDSQHWYEPLQIEDDEYDSHSYQAPESAF